MVTRTKAAAARKRGRVRGRRYVRSALGVTLAAPFAPALGPALGPDAARGALLYWDINGSALGGSNSTVANGTWGSQNFWSTSPTGSSTTAAWIAGSTAVFSAGTNVSAASSVSVSGTQSAAGITFEEGTVTLGGSGTILLSDDAGSTITLGVTAAARSAAITAALGAAGPVSITRGGSGAGTLSLRGANALPGGLSVAGGVRLNAEASGAFGGTAGGAVNVSGSGAIFSSTAGSALAPGSVVLDNDFVLNAGSATGEFATAFAAAGHFTGSTRLTFAGDISGDADVYITDSPPAAAPTAAVVPSGSGMTVFGGSNSYSGRTIINLAESGSFQIGSAGALPAGTSLVFGRGQQIATGQWLGIMDLAGQNVSVASLATDVSGDALAAPHGITNSSTPTPAGAGGAGGAGSAGAGGGITIAGDSTTTFAGVLGAVNNGSLNTFGFTGGTNLSLTLAATHSGSLTLSGANTYAGATTIDGGTLVAAHTATAAPTIAGDVVVNGGGRFSSAGGVGAGGSAAPTSAGVGGAVTINDGATIDPAGAGVGELRIAGGLLVNSDSATTGGKIVFTLESATSYDRIDLGDAALTLNEGFHPVEIAAAPSAAISAGTYTLMTFGSRAFDGVHGFSKTLDPGGGFSYTLDFTDAALRLIVAPLSQTLLWDVGGGGAPIMEGGGTWGDGSSDFFDVAANTGATFSNAGDADVVFGSDDAAAGGTILLSGNVRTGGKLIFGPIDPAAPYTIDGGAAAHVLTTVGGITANASASINAAVILESSQTWQVAADRMLAVGGNISAGTDGGAAVLTKTGGGVLALRGANDIGSLQVDAGVVAIAAGVTKVTTLALPSDASLDLRDNKLITTTPAGAATGGTYDGLQGQVQRAYNFTSWDRPGLTTSMPLARSGLTTIGIATGAQMRGLGESDTDTFAGQIITGASVIAMYTYAGDANLDGQIDAGDYGIIDNFVQIAGASGYANGDFNYDGFIDAGDYGIIDNNVQAQGAPFATSGSALASAVTVVPEPASIALLAAALACLPRRRRRYG